MIPVFILGEPSSELLQFFNSPSIQIYVLEQDRIPKELLPKEKKYLVVPAGSKPLTTLPTLLQLLQNFEDETGVLTGSSTPNGQTISNLQFRLSPRKSPVTTSDVYFRSHNSQNSRNSPFNSLSKRTLQIYPPLFQRKSGAEGFNWKALLVFIIVSLLLAAMTLMMVHGQQQCLKSSSSEKQTTKLKREESK